MESFVKKTIKKVAKGAVILTMIATVLSGCTKVEQNNNNSSVINKEPVGISMIKETHKLPSEEIVKNKLHEVLGDNYGDYLLDGESLVRLACPQGEPIYVNVEIDVTDEQKEIIDLCLEEYNNMFEVINPNYHFVSNYNPTEEDLKNPYNIDIKMVDNFKENDKGMARSNITLQNYSDNIDGKEAYNTVIEFTDECLESSQALMGTTKHEIGHVLGRSDAYNQDDVDKNTIMDGGQKLGASLYSKNTSLKKLDIAVFDAMYRDPENKLSDDSIRSFIDNYDKVNKHSYEDYVAYKDFRVYKDLLEEIDIDDLIEDIKNSAYDETIKEDIIKTLSETKKVNSSFGKSAGAIGECLKGENKYSHISWDNENNIHITQKNANGSGSFGSRQMKEYGGLIRYGDSYSGTILLNVGDYVLSFEYKKDYFNENITIDKDFKNVYKLTEMTEEQYFKYVNEFHKSGDLENN